jgi:hypothetical protein
MTEPNTLKATELAAQSLSARQIAKVMKLISRFSLQAFKGMYVMRHIRKYTSLHIVTVLALTVVSIAIKCWRVVWLVLCAVVMALIMAQCTETYGLLGGMGLGLMVCCGYVGLRQFLRSLADRLRAHRLQHH